MLKTLERLHSHKKNYHSFAIISEHVKNELGVTPENYNKEDISIEISHQGNKGLKSFDYLYCSICQKDKIPSLLSKYKNKLPDNPKINDLIDNWDILDISPELLDIAGCIIPDMEHINAAPNGRRYILRPTEHATNCHVKPSCSTGEILKSNMKTNTLVPNEKGIIKTEKMISKTSKNRQTSNIKT